ncbi:protein-L-isoaspartate O-methyltransferase family protein [Govanella unica]|uniref:Protein-L-isoaspartate O-methyltransferase n=1 Tax=Govanella unica TaxID=2975056 RepID=A0A9X3TX78_9PROT|nr:protein-L-isoaspartate O-methyltransferase [Govania unica]MDA5193284.1 protein-L-isoaspartate O-methyltransferase [Govania unica]
MTNYAIARDHMIEGQIKPNQVSDPHVLEAFRHTAREVYVPAALRGVAYVDESIEIAPGRYLMEPRVFARLLQAALPGAGDVVLDVGSGSGYSAAVLAALAGSVVALEEDGDLAARATALLAESGLANAEVVKGALVDGCAGHGPYQVIVLNGQVDEVPQALLDQLADGGRLVGVERLGGVGKAVLYQKDQGIVGRRELFDASVAPLPGFAKPKSFTF